ncbi:MAG: Fic family protein [Brachybacterium sp.]|uniref:type II toxin-antitoxin system death-on-curing family toxin n=1 Tax=Brachybacterium sp. TaxID=1891286 RepID=UPI002647457D|nr:Fic family protein [Brachybacterium sp.]MDN5687940.1 Fic family protein [Brachybacterium sp.]
MTRYIPVDAAILVFRKRIGPHPLIAGGHGKLDGAMKAPAASWDGVDLHETVFIKAAVLLRGVAVAHAFEDGNKRLAWLLIDFFLDLNGYALGEIDPHEVNDVVRAACEHDSITLDGIAAWLERHSEPS